MAEPTQPGELSDAALERALGRLRRPLPLDPDEIERVRELLKNLGPADLILVHEVIEQWQYDKRKTAEAARTKSAQLGRLPLIAFIFTVISSVAGFIAAHWYNSPGGH